MTSQQTMTLDDWLDDLCVRFIINLPQADLASMERICFQVEEAHWFYDDFIRPINRSLPPMTLRTFCLAIFKRCPLLASFAIEDHVHAFEQFLKYKTSIPVRGAILLNEAMDMALLVRGWKKGANWSFPKGKINMDEDDLDCAIREVDEETGFDIRAAGLVPPPENVKYIETNFRDQQIRLYVFRNVPLDTRFEAKTRKEIGGIQWYKISELPSYGKKNNAANGHETEDPVPPTSNKFYMVAQFIGPLRKWIASQRRKDAARAGNSHLTPQTAHIEDTYTEDEGNALPEPVMQMQGITDPNQILEKANRELRQMLRMPPLQSEQAPPVQPPQVQDAYADQNQNRANALLAVLQQGGTTTAPPPPAPAANPGMSLNHLLSQLSQPQQQQPPPQQQQYEPQQPPYQQQQHQHQHQQPPPPHHQMPQPGPPMQGQPPQGYPQYGAPPQNPQQQQQQQYSRQHLAQQNQHLQQRFQLHQQAPQNSYQQHHLQGQQANPFAPNSQGPPPPYTTNSGNQQGQGQGQGQAQAFAQAQAAAAAFRSQQNPPPQIPLLHPQPLPPVVQKALFAREMLVSPDVSGHQGNTMLPPPPPPQQQQQQQPYRQVPLSNHAANLLSAFKKDNAAASGAPQPTAGGPGWQQQQPQQQQQQPRHASHAVPQQTAQQPQQPYATLPHNHQLHGSRPQPPPQAQQPTSQHQYGSPQTGAAPALHPGQAAPNPTNNGSNDQFNQYMPRPAPLNNAPQDQPPVRIQHSEQHRSSLLGMFTKQTVQQPSQAAQPPHAPSSGSPAGAPVSPQHGSHPQGVTTQRTVYSATTVSTTQAQQPNPVHGQGQAIEAAARANGGPIEMNADLNLPFGALSLLTRPKQQSGSPAQNNGAHVDRSQQHPSTFASPITELPAETTRLRKQPSIPRQVSQPYSTSPSERRPSTRGSQPPYNSNPAAAAVAAAAAATGIPAVTATLPQVVRRPSYASSSSTAPVDHSQHAHPHNPPPPAHAYQSAAPPGGANIPANPEHQKKLLSLFSKQPQATAVSSQAPPVQAQAPPAMSAASVAGIAGTGLHPMSGMHAPHQQHLPPHGQQFGPFEAADSGPTTDGGASRRGSSQTPISPANRNFLLGYLASVSGQQ